MAIKRTPSPESSGHYDYLAEREHSLQNEKPDAGDTLNIIGGSVFMQYARALRLKMMGEKTATQIQQEQEEARADRRVFAGLTPYDADFSFDKYDNDPEYAKNREMDEADRVSSRQFAESEEAGGPESSGRRYHSRPASGSKIREIGPIAVGAKQAEYFSALPSVAAVTGVPVAMIGAMWGNESRFSSLGNSPSGCVGAGQFTRGTFAAVIKQYGDRIPGMEGYAAGLRNGTISVNDADMLAMRNDQKVSAYASGFYLAEIAKGLKVDPTKQENWGVMYAGYVVGPGNARKMMNASASNDDRSAASMFPKEAGWNPMFFNGGEANAAQALGNFQSTINNTYRAFDQQIVAKFDPARTVYAGGPAPSITVAKNSDAKPEIKIAEADPFAGTIYAAKPVNKPPQVPLTALTLS